MNSEQSMKSKKCPVIQMMHSGSTTGSDDGKTFTFENKVVLFNCLGSECALWQWGTTSHKPDDLGYCGMGKSS